MGRQRSEEARKLISQKSKDDAKAVFERNSSAGQMNFRRQSSSTSVPPPPQVSLVPGACMRDSIFFYGLLVEIYSNISFYPEDKFTS